MNNAEENIKLLQELLTKNAYRMQKRNANESQKFYEHEFFKFKKTGISF